MGRPSTFSNETFHKKCAFLLIKNARNDLFVRARFSRSRGCMKPKICREIPWVQPTYHRQHNNDSGGRIHAHLEQYVQRHVGHILEAASSTTNGLSTRGGICGLFAGTCIGRRFRVLGLGFLAGWHGEGSGFGDDRSDPRARTGSAFRTRLPTAHTHVPSQHHAPPITPRSQQ